MLTGRYDVLGYADVDFGAPPDWYRDPIHDREASREFWADVRYLDPNQGDHKITWEINRHQHWLGFARAFHLTGDVRYYAAVVGQLENWLAVNPPLQGVNWASMLEIGLRSLSWLWTLHFFAPVATHDPLESAPWTIDLLVGLDRQLVHVERNLSLYFSPNTHLSGEALALYVTGRALPELRGSRRRASLGRRLLLQAIDRQILGDGGHAERSAHYHRYTTDFYLLALLTARATEDPAATDFEHALRRLAGYLRDLTDDKGRLPLLGDDDGGQLFPIANRPPWDCRDTLAAASIALEDRSLALDDAPEEVHWICGGLPTDSIGSPGPLPRPSTALADSGYYVSRSSTGDHLVFDAGRHGFLNGGHAHADALSITLTVQGQPLLIDPGTGTYTMNSALRDLMRSTAMHNTVVVNGQPQARPRGAFHWHHATDARSTLWQSETRFDYAEGRHDGYGPIVHSRGVLVIHGFGWLIIDHLLGSGDAAADTMWHIHPSWQLSGRGHAISLRCGTLIADLASSIARWERREGDDLDLYSPVYGRIEHATCLSMHTEGPLPRAWLSFISVTGDERRDFEPARVEPLPLTVAPEDWSGAAFRITTPHRRVCVLSAVPLRDGQHPPNNPSRPWGCASLRTAGRLAVADESGDPGLSIQIGR